ncbi:MAG: hypothetical protein EAS52_13955, partial [Parapedobacter sp.]
MNNANSMPRMSFSWIVLAIVVALTWQCRGPAETNAGNTAFAKYVEGYTTGVISRESTIRLRLASQVNTFQETNVEETRKLFTIHPAVKGKTRWIDARTVEFIPEKQFDPSKEYQVTFDLGKVIEVPDDLKNFIFDFKIIDPSFSIELDGLKSQTSSAPDLMKLTGTLSFADIETPENIEKILEATAGSNRLTIKWQHNAQTRTSSFTIDSLEKRKEAYGISLKWDGSPIKSKRSDQKNIEVPAKGVFKVLDIRAVHEPEQFVLVQFSDPILVAQQLDGLIGISGVSDARYTIDGSEVKVYAPDRLEGDYAIAVNEGIENISGKKITAAYSANVNFENR